jgi:HAMP domain-containing protein
MTQELFPEIEAAVKALENQITATETEIGDMKKAIGDKKQLVRSWRKALIAANPKGSTKKKAALHRVPASA